MITYIQEMIMKINVQDTTGKISKMPAADNLFSVDPDSLILKEEQASMFHTTVDKDLFLTKQADNSVQEIA